MSEAKSSLFIQIGFLIVGFILVFALGTPPAFRPPPGAFLAPPKDLKHFTFGYNETFSDSLWIRVIQDIDYCEAEKVKDEQWGGSELCSIDKGWVFRMLDSITVLTPRFRAPYAFGAIALSVIVNDRAGAAMIFDRGIENHPTDWVIQYRAAYHQLYELNNPQRAAELLTMAGKNGAPPWTFFLASRLYSKAGQAEVARAVLNDMIEQDREGRYTKRLQERLSQIEAEAAKEAADAQKAETSK